MIFGALSNLKKNPNFDQLFCNPLASLKKQSKKDVFDQKIRASPQSYYKKGDQLKTEVAKSYQRVLSTLFCIIFWLKIVALPSGNKLGS